MGFPIFCICVKHPRFQKYSAAQTVSIYSVGIQASAHKRHLASDRGGTPSVLEPNCPWHQPRTCSADACRWFRYEHLVMKPQLCPFVLGCGGGGEAYSMVPIRVASFVRFLVEQLQVQAHPHLPGRHLVQQQAPRRCPLVLQLLLDGGHRNFGAAQEV